MLSPAAYDAIQHVLLLPSNRTLRDYTHYIKSGIQSEVTMQLMNEAKIKTSEEWEKFVAVAFDIKEGIVYNKHQCKIIGFVDLGTSNNHPSAFENSIGQPQNTLPVAKQMFTVMVIGIFTSLCFPYSHYPTAGITGEKLFPIIWENI